MGPGEWGTSCGTRVVRGEEQASCSVMRVTAWKFKKRAHESKRRKLGWMAAD